MSDQDICKTELKGRDWVGKRLALSFVIALGIALGFSVLQYILGVGNPGVSIGISILFVLPACIAALIAFLVDPDGQKPKKFYVVVPLNMVLVVLAVGALFLREGVICMVILSPLWIISGIVGGVGVYRLQTKFKERAQSDVFNCSILAALPFLALAYDMMAVHKAQDYTVMRSIEIERSVENVWPYLLDLKNITLEEGQWNISQNVLRIPRPRAAYVEGEGLQARRYAQWGEHISFEEHIIRWEPNAHMSWRFVFPNDSLQNHTDRHISPDGVHLRISDGGYRLERLSENSTRLILYTHYVARTPVNAYSALWGQIFLGGIQGNILHIVKERSEKSA